MADEVLGPEDLMPRLRIDGDLAFRGITGDVTMGVASLAPFGAGNPRPVFAARGVELVDGPRKLKERHLKMALKQDDRIFRAIAWRAAERLDFITEHKSCTRRGVLARTEPVQWRDVRRVDAGRRQKLGTGTRLKPLTQTKAGNRSGPYDCVAAENPPRPARWRGRSRDCGRGRFQTTACGRSPPPLTTADPKAVVESEGGWKSRFNRAHEEVRINYKTLSTYPDNSAKLSEVKVTTIRAGGRTFVITGNEADLKGETDISIHGDVRIVASDGMEIRTEHATYTDADAVIRAPGPVEFTRGRLSGTGLGATYAKNDDELTIGERAVVHMTPTADGTGAANFTAGTVEFSRNQHVVHLNGGMTVTRGRQTLEAESGVAHLSEDEQRLEALELRNKSRVTTEAAATGGLRGMRARDIDVKYGADGETLESAVLDGKAEVDVAGERDQPSRTIAANHLEIALSADGSTPKSVVGNDAVQLTIPADRTDTRTDHRRAEARGPRRGRSRADDRPIHRRCSFPRAAKGSRSPGALGRAHGHGKSRLEPDRRRALRAERPVRRRRSDRDGRTSPVRPWRRTLALTGSEPANPVPRMENPRISVGASNIDVTLDGPIVVASKSVRSALKPAAGKAAKTDASGKVPSMFKQDQLVAATAEQLRYDGGKSSAVYTGNAQLWQGDTSIKGSTITIDQESGDLSAAGPVVTAITLEQEAKDKKREKVRSTGTSKDFAYEESSRRATYTGDAHMNGPQGDMTATKIELYLKQSGDELDRAEAYETVTLRDQNREDQGRAHDLLQRRRALRRHRRPGHDHRRMRPGDHRPDGDLQQDHRHGDRRRQPNADGDARRRQLSVPMTPATLKTINLTKSYGGRTVVRGVNLDVSSGEMVGLLGPNGAGKTTTFYMTVGLTAPDSGRVELDGRDVTDDPMYVRARKGIGYLPQEASIFRGLTVEQNIVAILETLGSMAPTRRARLRELLAELNLTPLAQSPAYTLSGGERRRAEITRALVTSPKFILLDEPFAGIDPIAVTDIQKIIFHLRDRGIGVLITDHNVRETLRITDRAYIVHEGVIFKSGTPDSLAADDDVRRIYLGTEFRLD